MAIKIITQCSITQIEGAIVSCSAGGGAITL